MALGNSSFVQFSLPKPLPNKGKSHCCFFLTGLLSSWWKPSRAIPVVDQVEIWESKTARMSISSILLMAATCCGRGSSWATHLLFFKPEELYRLVLQCVDLFVCAKETCYLLKLWRPNMANILRASLAFCRHFIVEIVNEIAFCLWCVQINCLAWKRTTWWLALMLELYRIEDAAELSLSNCEVLLMNIWAPLDVTLSALLSRLRFSNGSCIRNPIQTGALAQR